MSTMTRLWLSFYARADTMYGWAIIEDISIRNIHTSSHLIPNFGPGIYNIWHALIFPQWWPMSALKPDEKRYILLGPRLTKIALAAHSQGTVLAFLALARGQVPQLGKSLSCFVALAPAVYAGTVLSDSFPFSFIRIMSKRTYRAVFGIHLFIPLMSVMHSVTPGRVYGWLGYRVFNYLFSWSDLNWEARLRNRFFQFSPVIVSAECMRWWLGTGGHPSLFQTEKRLLFTSKMHIPGF